MTPQVEPTPTGMTFRCKVGADPFAVRATLAALMQSAPVAGLDAERCEIAEQVLAEVLNNVAEHAYAGGTGDITVTLWRCPAGLSCLIVDQGRAMPDGRLPPGLLPDAANVALSDLPEGGFGWHLIRTLTADLHYVRDQGQNRLSFLI